MTDFYIPQPSVPNLERLRMLEKRVLRLEQDAKLLRPLAEWAINEIAREQESRIELDTRLGV